MRGLEPPRGCPHTDLNRARLPIPPHPRAADTIASRPTAESAVATHTMAAVTRVAVIALAALLAVAAGADARSGSADGPLVEVIVALDGAPLADAVPARMLT